MKKLILFAAFCCLCLTSNAQLKVDSEGKASIQKSDPEGDATLDIGDFPNSLIYDNDCGDRFLNETRMDFMSNN